MDRGAYLSKGPLISVIMNCYNGEKYLRQAIESVIGQSWKNWELIFWDNQSTDRSAEIFKSYDNPKLKYYCAPKHTLLYEARNYAIEKAQGEFYAFLDVDDWWLPDKLEKQIVLFDDPEVGLACGNYWVRNEPKSSSWIAHRRPVPQGLVLQELLQDYYVGLLTLMVRKEAVDLLEYPFDPRYHIIGDLDMVVRLSANWKLSYVAQPIANYRIHGANETGRHRSRHVQELETWSTEMRQYDTVKVAFQKGYFDARFAYIKAMNEVLQENNIVAFGLFLRMPWGRLKLRLLAALVLPSWLLIKLKN